MAMTPMQPPAVLLEGTPGAGKTYALPTFALADVETFVICTEPGGAESLIDSCEDKGIPLSRIHWSTCLPAAQGWKAIEDAIRTIGSSSFEDIQKIKSGVGKTETRAAAMKFLDLIRDFQCERTGQSYGDVASWDHTRALCVDSLSGLSLISMELTTGYKPSAHQGEWGVAMNFLEKLILKLTSDRRCFFALTAHVEKEIDELSGVSRVMPSTLGKKLSPKLPRFFSEVVYAKRSLVQGKPHFSWSTIDPAADLKNRSLPISTDLKPDFGQVVNAYRKRLVLAGAQSAPPPVKPEPSPAPLRPSAAPMRPVPTPNQPPTQR